MSTVSNNTDNVFSLLNLQSQIEKTSSSKKSRGVLLCTGKDGVVQAKEKGTAFGRFFTIALRRGGREAHNLQKCIESISKQIESCKFFTKEELKDHAGKLENLVNTLNSLIDKYNSSPKHKKQPIQKLDLIFKKSTLAEDTSNPGAIGSPSGVTTPDHPKKVDTGSPSAKHTWKAGIKQDSPPAANVTIAGSRKKEQPQPSFDIPVITVTAKTGLSVAEEIQKTKEIFKSQLGGLFDKISDDLGIFKPDESVKDTETWRKKVPESIINYFKTRTSDGSIPSLLRERADTLNLYAKDSFTEWNKHLSLLLNAIKNDLATVRGSARVSFRSHPDPVATQVKKEEPLAEAPKIKLEPTASTKKAVSIKDQLKNQLLQLKTSEQRSNVEKQLYNFAKNWGLNNVSLGKIAQNLKTEVDDEEWEKQINNLFDNNNVKEMLKSCEEVVTDTRKAFSQDYAGNTSIFIKLNISIPTEFTSFKEVKEMVIAKLNECRDRLAKKPEFENWIRNLKNNNYASKEWFGNLRNCINALQNSI